MQKQFETYKERVPSWALGYIVNGDIDGLTDEEIQMINNWLNANDYEIVSPVNDGEEYFSNCPAFGLPGGVVDCDCLVRIKNR